MNPPSDLIARLQSILPGDAILTTREDLIPYAFDGTAALKQLPRCVVFPGSTDEVAAVVRTAREFRVPLVTRGSGTGLSGGSVPAPECIVVCLLRMNQLLELDTANFTLLAETGLTTIKIDEAATAAGLFYPPDPSSMKVSTIGGNVANNSGGLRGLKYGVTRDYVMGLEVVLPDGQIAWLGSKCVKDVAGYSLKDLFVGSEGTLGIITKVLLKLTPRPEAKRTLLATFDSTGKAAACVSAILAETIVPCTMEFLDRTTIGCVEDFTAIGLPRDCEALLFLETDGPEAVVSVEARLMESIARDGGATRVEVADDEKAARQLATARRSAFAALARIRPTTILEDVTVPRSRLAEMVGAIEEVAERYQLQIATFGHFGDGNLHPTILTDETDPEEMERVEAALEAIFAKTVEIGGTITGEHGVGLAKKKALTGQLDPASFSLLRAIKKTLDPDYLLNPGKIFDREDPNP